MQLQRIIKIIYHDLSVQKKIIGLASLSGIIFLSILGYFNSLDGYAFILYSVGLVITSNAFTDLNTPEKGQFFLTLPASSLEKLTARWLLTGIVFMFYSYLLYLLCSLITLNINGNGLMSLHLLSPMILAIFAKYLVLNSVALLGAIYFRRYNLIKTSLCVGALISIITAVVFLASYITCPNCMYFSIMHLLEKVFLGAYYFFWILLLPICLLISYQRLKEYEL